MAIETKKSKIENKHPIWVLLMLLLTSIEVSPEFIEILLEILPSLEYYKKFILIAFFFVVMVLGTAIVLKESEDENNKDDKKEESLIKETYRKTKIKHWFLKIFKEWPLNIVTLKIIPLAICWFFQKIGTRGYEGNMSVFDLPEPWKEHDLQRYNHFKNNYFKQIIRVRIIKKGESWENMYRAYEIKFSKDFKDLYVGATEIGGNGRFLEDERIQDIKFPENQKEDKRVCTVVSWSTIFGLYWNLRRCIKKIEPKTLSFPPL